jgi:hypothetical protein
MYSLIKETINNDSFYWFFALLGSGLFAIQLGINLIGFGSKSPSSSLQFKWMSKQALTSFLMMFGWTALTCRKEFDLEQAWVIAISCMSGLVAFLATALIFKIVKSLSHDGAVFNVDDAINKEAVVYQRIPKDGKGKISINLNDITRKIDAYSHNNEEVPSFTEVTVVKKSRVNVVVVKQI